MLGSCGLCSILKIKRIIREMIQNSLTRRQKCSDLFRGIRRRLPLPEEAKSERGGPGVVIQTEKKHLLVAAILPYGDFRDTVHAHVSSQMYTHTHIHTHMQFPVLQNP